MVVVAAAYAVVYSWPVAIQPWRYVWGSHGDALGNAYEYTWAAATVRAGQSLGVNHQTAWPFGDALGSLPHDPLFWWFTIGLSLLIGAIPALNLLSLIAIPLASWTMYRLALRVVRVPAAAFVAGIAFGCSTYLLQNSRGEPTLAQAWVFPLEALALIAVLSKPRPLSVLLAGAAVALAATVDFYYALFAALIAAILSGSWIVFTFLEQRRLPYRSLIAIASAGLVAVAIAGLVYVGTLGNLSRQADSIRRPVTQLMYLEVHPLDLVLPPRFNPWFGGPRTEMVAQRLRDTGALVDLAEVEVALPILVLVPIGLVLIAMGLASRRREPPWQIAEVGALVVVSLVGLWLMVPPDAVPRHSLSLEWDIYRLAPQFQAYHRAILIVDLGACVVAALALARLLPRRAVYSIPVVALLCGAILAENFFWPPDRYLTVAAPPEYDWLAAHPGDYAIAEYPLFTNDAGGNEWTYDFNTRFHSHPTINGHISDSENASMRVELEDPNRPGVAADLATLGVRYVVWHGDLAGVATTYGAVAAHTDAGDAPQAPSYLAVATFPDQAVVYSVQPSPERAFPFFAAGFSALDSPGGRPLGRWLLDGTGQIDLYVAANETTTQVTLGCWSSAPAATLVLSQGASRLGATQLNAAGISELTFAVPIHPGINRVEMSVSPGAPPGDRGAAFCTLPAVAAG